MKPERMRRAVRMLWKHADVKEAEIQDEAFRMRLADVCKNIIGYQGHPPGTMDLTSTMSNLFVYEQGDFYVYFQWRRLFFGKMAGTWVIYVIHAEWGAPFSPVDSETWADG